MDQLERYLAAMRASTVNEIDLAANDTADNSPCHVANPGPAALQPVKAIFDDQADSWKS
jgi:hypothetical protein